VRSARAILAACAVAFVSAALAGEPDYAAMLRNHESRMDILREGVKALPPLLAIAVGKDQGLAEEAERAIRWLAVRANDAPDQRALMAKALLEAADKADNPKVRKLAIAALALCGRDEAVPLLAAMANTPALAPTACDTLAQIPGNAATQAIKAAFAQAKGEPRLLLGEALARRRDPAAAAVVGTMLDDEALRQVAFDSLIRTQGVAALKELAGAIDKAEPVFRARMLRVLAERRFPEALPAALKYAAEEYGEERLAAIEALGRLGDARAAPILLEAAKSQDAAVKAAALAACRRLADALVAEKPKDAAAMLARVLPQATSDAERLAAIGSLARTRLPSAVPAIAPLLAGADWRVCLAAARALANIPGDEATQAMRKGLKDATPPVKAALLEALAARGATSAVPDILPLAAEGDDAVRVAALHALAALAAPEAKPAVLVALDKGSEPVRTAAAEALLAIADATLDKGDKPGALAAYHKILTARAGPEPTRCALAGVQRIASPDSLPIVEPHLKGKRAVRNAAAEAQVAIAATLAAGGDRETAKAILTKLAQLKPPLACSAEAAQKLRAIGVAVDIAARNGIVSHWWIIGAWPAPINKWADPRFPEKQINLLKAYAVDGRQLKWKPVSTEDPRGAVMLDDLVTPNDNAVCYAFTEIHIAKEQDAILEIASDDGAVLWINGQKVYEHLENRGWGTPPDKVKMRLPAASKLLLKACEGSGTWGFRLRLLRPDGKPLAFQMR